MRISYTETNIVSNQTKARFHMTHVIKEFHRVHPNWFPSIWYVPCKPCTYFASRLALSPNRSNRASNWASSFRSTNRCIKNGFFEYGALGTNYAFILHRSEIPYDTRHLGVPLGASKLISYIWYVPCKLCNYLASRLALYTKRPNRASTWASSTTSTIGCV